jgi:hypothetical protein
VGLLQQPTQSCAKILIPFATYCLVSINPESPSSLPLQPIKIDPAFPLPELAATTPTSSPNAITNTNTNTNTNVSGANANSNSSSSNPKPTAGKSGPKRLIE